MNSSGPVQLLPEVEISECGNLTEEYALVTWGRGEGGLTKVKCVLIVFFLFFRLKALYHSFHTRI